ncbi:MAG: GNAT family N-acetyltransferase [Desulfobacterales bacterium]|nr:MAG: GNAT family N-acetyltransferase [Desulfobacterales bacterium]
MEDPEITIRCASTADAAFLAALGAQTFSEAFGSRVSPADLAAYLAQAFTVERLARELADACATFSTAYVQGAPAGYTKLHISPVPGCVAERPAVELVRFYLLKRWWGRGVGAALMQSCLELARRQGFATIWLSSWKKNERANTFYHKWRFRVVGERTFTIGTDVQEDFIMAFALTDPRAMRAQRIEEKRP